MAIPLSSFLSADGDCAAAAGGLLFVVGGHSRNVGKTGVIEHLLTEHGGEAWAVVKISAHRHAPDGTVAPLIEEHRDADPETQTGRYLLAGARHAFLVRAPDAAMARAAAFVESLRANGWNVMVESNRIVTHVVPTLVVFVVDPHNADWKPSSDACLAVADVVVYRDGAPTCVRERVERTSADARGAS
jgi:hypothetical protein